MIKLLSKLMILKGLPLAHGVKGPFKGQKRRWQKAILQGLLLTSPMWGLIRPVVAAPTPPGTIDNRATGSFIDTATDGTVEIFSNTVTVTVVEVAGITIVAQTPVEATPSQAGTNAGTYQGFDGLNAGDLVYFDFVITNVGNDPTAFFIPAAPVSVTGGTFNSTNAPLQIIAVDPDGSGTGYSPITNLNGSNGPFNVTTAGNTTTLLGATNGYIPADGTVTVRVPIRITETTIGNSIAVVLGQTPTVGDQNIVYTAGSNDVYTVDLADTATNPYTSPATTPETPGAPNAVKEASAQGATTLAAPNVDFGDVPDTTSGTGANDYQTTIGDVLSTTDDGALHRINSTLKMGTNAPDADNGTLQNANADADDTQATDDEDGVTLPNIFTTTTSYSVTVNVTNTIGSGAYLVGWIDFNSNGVFETSEGIAYDSDGNPSNGIIAPIANNTSNSNLTLTWTGLSGLTAGTTYAHFRLSDSASLTTSTPTGLVGSGEVEDYPLTIQSALDYGDAPDTYSTDSTNNSGEGVGAAHILLSNPQQLKIGATAPDNEVNGAASSSANGDDTAGTDDEDTIAFPTLQTNTTTYTLDVTVTNSTGSTATLVGWIDFDRDGVFQADEGTTVSVPNGTANPVTLTWNNIGGSGPNISNGSTFARFRLTTSAITTANFNGVLSDGEVEDHPLTIDLYTVPPGGPTLTCDPTFYVVIGSGGATGTSRVYTVQRNGTSYAFNAFGSATTNFTINALGYNPVDNYLYAMVVDSTNGSFPQGAVVRMDNSGTLSNLGVPSQSTTDANDGVTLTSTLVGPNQTMNNMLPAGTPAINNTNFVNVLDRSVQVPGGAFLAYGSRAGTYVVSTAPVSRNTGSVTYTPIFFIDVTPATGPTFDFRGVVNGIFSDFFVNPQDTTNDRLYAIDESPTGNNQLVYFDPSSPSTVPTVVDGDLGFAANAGTQYADTFGTIYSRAAGTVPNTDPGTFYGIDPSGVAQSLTTTDAGGQHDGTSCPTVQMEKKPNTRSVTAGNTVTYTYRIANGRDVPLTVNFTDNLSTVTDYTPTTGTNESTAPINGTFVNGTVNVVAPATSDTPVLSNSNRTLTIPNVVLPARSITTITANVLVPSAAATGTYYNQSQLSNVNLSIPALPSTVLSDDPGENFAGTDQVFKNFGDPTYLNVTAATSTTPNLLLVKRITRLIPGNGDPEVDYSSTLQNDGIANSQDDNPKWPANYLGGVLQLANVSPGDMVEYTVYFLNAGDGPANNTRICDPLSNYLEYIPNTYTGAIPTDGGLPFGLGLRLTLGNVTPNTVYLTGENDTPDRGRFIGPGVDLTGTCKIVTNDNGTPLNPSDDTIGDLTGTLNTNGVVIVDVTGNAVGQPTNVDDVTAPTDADDDDALGFIRFRARVK